MKAKKSRSPRSSPEALGVDIAPGSRCSKPPSAGGRKAGVKVSPVAELVQKLKVEADLLRTPSSGLRD